MTATTNERRTLSDHDHRMIAHAKHRRTVAVDRHDGRTTPATLIAWHPGSHPNARVQFVNGSRAITEKPAELMRALINVVPDNGVVLDPFLGSGTTLRAAKDCGRRGIGIELDATNCEIAAKRMAQEVLDFGAAS